MTTINIKENIDLGKIDFNSVQELYFKLQENLVFEQSLQNKAKEAYLIDESDLINL